MAFHNLLDTKTASMGDLLGNGKTYQVPPYQRDYSWREENWDDLWQDIMAIRNKKDARHYMGSIVLQGAGEKKFTVIDGQQRLTTLSIIAMAVIRQIRKLATDGVDVDANKERADILERTYLGDKDPASLVRSSKLELNLQNDDFFQGYLVQLKDHHAPHTLSDTDKALHDAQQYFSKRLQHDMAAVVRDGQALALFLTNEVASRLLFIQIVVEDELSAYTVFETLNARGVELTTTDLLKNYLFSLVKTKADQAHLARQWQQISGRVGQDRLPEFLRHYLNSIQTPVRTQRLFQALRERIRGGTEVMTLLGDLLRESDVYAALFEPADKFWRDLPEIRTHLRALSLFRARQIAPLLLAGYRKLSSQEFLKLVKLGETITFRYTVIGGYNTNELERAYSLVAVKLQSGAITTLTQLKQELRQVYTDDARFKNDFTQKTLSYPRHKKLIGYILHRLEADAARASERSFEDDPGTIEHILPANAEASWATVFPATEQEAFIDRLGNHTLLEPSINRELGNVPYDRKKAKYANSEYAMTRGITTDTWTMDAVVRRQEHMATRAAHLWRIDF